MSNLCTVADLAKMLNVRERTIRTWVRYKRIVEPSRRTVDGGPLWTSEEARKILDWWLKRNEGKTRQPKRVRNLY